jgi:hypothetical protein
MTGAKPCDPLTTFDFNNFVEDSYQNKCFCRVKIPLNLENIAELDGCENNEQLGDLHSALHSVIVLAAGDSMKPNDQYSVSAEKPSTGCLLANGADWALIGFAPVCRPTGGRRSRQ